MKQRGFTLIEMIVTIVVVGVIGLAIAGFVEYGMKGYVETIDRQKVQVDLLQCARSPVYIRINETSSISINTNMTH